MSDRPPMTLKQQADFIGYLVERAGSMDGWTVRETWMLLKADEISDLRLIAERLHRMAPHEDRIRQMVIGK